MMNNTQFEKIAAGHFLIKGELNFNSVAELWLENKENLFNDPGNILAIDFSQLSRSDSSGLALLLEWYRESQQQGKKITFVNLPEQMLHMAEVCGLDNVLPIQKRQN